MNSNQVTVSINGKIVPPSEASISVFDHGLLAGLGVFETMLAEDKHIFRLSGHLARFVNSCKVLGLPLEFTTVQITEFLREALESFPNDCHSAFRRIRLTITAGNDGNGLWGQHAFAGSLIAGSLIIIIQEHALPDESAGPTAEIVSSPVSLHWLAEHKVLSRMMFSHPAPSQSRQNLLILYHPAVGITEFSLASLFIRKGKRVLTSIDKNVFPGTCRSEIINNWPAIASGYKLQRQKLEIDDLLNADEVIGVNSLRTAFSVSELINSVSDDSKTDPITIKYPESYESSLCRIFRHLLLKH